MDAELLKQHLDAGALPFLIGDRLYMRLWYGACWIVWKCERDSPEYFVHPKLRWCTCPTEGRCKHLEALEREVGELEPTV